MTLCFKNLMTVTQQHGKKVFCIMQNRKDIAHLSQGSGFREFCAVMDPIFSLPSKAMISAQLQTEYTE